MPTTPPAAALAAQLAKAASPAKLTAWASSCACCAIGIGLWAMCLGVRAQPVPEALPAPAAEPATEPTTRTDPAAADNAPVTAAATAPSGQAWRVGLGWHRYTEPKMRLQGPQLRLITPHLPSQTPWMPELSSEWSAANLHYSSNGTGSMSGVLALHGQVTGLWPLPAWGQAKAHTGLRVDADWVDMRGTSSTGHLGYRRQGTRLWAMGVLHWPDTGTLEAGALLVGRQFTQLSDVPDTPRSGDLVNIQRRGLWLRYEHQQAAWARWRPFVRWSWLDNSDYVGLHGWYEPRNSTLQIGASQAW